MFNIRYSKTFTYMWLFQYIFSMLSTLIIVIQIPVIGHENTWENQACTPTRQIMTETQKHTSISWSFIGRLSVWCRAARNSCVSSPAWALSKSEQSDNQWPLFSLSLALCLHCDSNYHVLWWTHCQFPSCSILCSSPFGNTLLIVNIFNS